MLEIKVYKCNLDCICSVLSKMNLSIIMAYIYIYIALKCLLPIKLNLLILASKDVVTTGLF